MASLPILAVGPNGLLSIIGLLHGRDKTVPTPAEDWRQATVDVVISAFNEEDSIVVCLASVFRQTLRPKRIILVDDGSTDRTLEFARTFCEVNNQELIAIHRKESIGKTPTIKRQAREFDSDVEFILDADTTLESDNYIERTVQELYQAVGIACACGTILPMRTRDRLALIHTPFVQKFLAKVPNAPTIPQLGRLGRERQGLTNVYREILYLFLQRFVYVGQMTFFGTIMNPVGCAVAYRRKYVKDLFDRYEPLLGDDLTNSEDIFIGFALLSEGYRNIQLQDVYARSQEPQVNRLPRQLYKWSSSFLQSCYYFDALVKTPLRLFKYWRHRRRVQREQGAEILEKRKIQEPYRQAFGLAITAQYGRPGGWPIFMGLFEKIGYPVVLLLMIFSRHWIALGYTIGIEILLSLVVLMIIAPGHRLMYLLKGLLVQPVRYAGVVWDLVTIGRFANDLWIRKNKSWRK